MQQHIASLKPTGFWGEASATTNFCEPDYEHTRYIAELANTLSSLPIMLVGIAGLLHCHAQKLDRSQAVAYAVIAVVGLGSIVFHATLLRTGQVLDELPMLWAVLALLCVVLETKEQRLRRHASTPREVVPQRWRHWFLAIYVISAGGLYFTAGFGAFIITYAISVVALIVLAIATIFNGYPISGNLPKRLLVVSACTYAGSSKKLRRFPTRQ